MAKQKQDDGSAPKLTINDSARLAGVSKKTVSRVINRSPLLNEETREKVEAIIRETGYVPNPQARALALGRNFLIGLIYDNPNAQMVLSMQRGILEALHGTEFELVIRPVDRGSNQVMDDIRGFVTRQRLFGVVVLPPMSENDALARMLDEQGCRYVRMGSAMLDDAEHMVASNDREAVADAVRHLIAQGHRRIGLIAGPHGFRSAQERREGFEMALAEAGISLPRSLVADGQYTFESGLSASESLFDLTPRPTAIFASNDEMAAAVVSVAHRRQLHVPHELTVVGFDDTTAAVMLWPPLTTVHQPVHRLAKEALGLLVQEIASGTPASADGRDVILDYEIVVRQSSAPPV